MSLILRPVWNSIDSGLSSLIEQETEVYHVAKWKLETAMLIARKHMQPRSGRGRGVRWWRCGRCPRRECASAPDGRKKTVRIAQGPWDAKPRNEDRQA